MREEFASGNRAVDKSEKLDKFELKETINLADISTRDWLFHANDCHTWQKKVAFERNRIGKRKAEKCQKGHYVDLLDHTDDDYQLTCDIWDKFCFSKS